MARAFDWLFRNRRTGGITIVQFPNLPLWLFIAGAVTARIVDPEGDAGAILTVFTTASLASWAFLELGRGVNPFRRTLGAVALGVIVYGVVLR